MTNPKLPKGIEELPSGRYRAITWNRHTKRKGPSRTFDGMWEAAAWKERQELDMFRAYKAQGLDVAPPVKAVTFADYASDWTASGPISTQRTARSHARQLAPRFRATAARPQERGAPGGRSSPCSLRCGRG